MTHCDCTPSAVWIIRTTVRVSIKSGCTRVSAVTYKYWEGGRCVGTLDVRICTRG